MYPWAFCPACHLVPLWSLLHTLYPIWAAGLGQGEKDLLQNPNCIQLSNKALLSLKEKRIKNSCYIYSGKKEAPFTDNRESFFLDRAMPTTAFSFLFSPLSPPFSKVKDWLLSVPKSGSSLRKKVFLIPDSVLPCLLWVRVVGYAWACFGNSHMEKRFASITSHFREFRMRRNTGL